MKINDLRKTLYNKETNTYSWKEICSMNKEALLNALFPNGLEAYAKEEVIGNVTFTGKKLTSGALEAVKVVNEKDFKKKCSKLSEFEIQRATNEIRENVDDEDYVPTWEEIWNTHKELQHRVCHQKREIATQVQVFAHNLKYNTKSGYYEVNLSKKKKASESSESYSKEWLFEIAVPNSDLVQTCKDLQVDLISFDPEDIKDFPRPNKPNSDKKVDPKFALKQLYKYGLKDISKEKNNLYFPIGLSASKARSGGVVWLANVPNWTEMEKLRAKVLHLTDEEYKRMKKDPCVIAKFETGTIGMRTSSVINVSKAGEKLRGSNILKDIKIKVIPDIVHKRVIKTLEPDTTATGEFKPFKFKLASREQEINYSDGTSIIKLQKYIDILYQAGEITIKQYLMFTTKWKESGYDINILRDDEDLYKFLTSKDFKALMQVRFFGGVKGTVLPVAEMDGDERLADTDMLVFKKSAKYITNNDAPFEIINFSKVKPEKATLNTQFVQCTIDAKRADILIKGAEKAFKEVINVLKDPASTLKFIAGMRGLNDDGEDLMTKLANDIEVEPRLITEHYHHAKILKKVEKYIKEIGFGKIPVKGNFKYIIVDPVYLYHQAMSDDFESDLKTGEVYCNHVNGFEAGMWRNPMVHYSEPQKVMTKDVNYLWMYKDIIVLNPYDGIAPALGGADYDGDKCLFIVDYCDGSFESDFVQQIKMPGYIIYDEGHSAPKVENNISNRLDYYVALSNKNRVGDIANWVTCTIDLMNDAELEERIEIFIWYKNVLIRLRYGEGWEIDLVKTGVTADGPNGDMLPKKYCKPLYKPLWFVDMREYQKREISTTTTIKQDDGTEEEISIVYKGNSPMQQLHDYAETFWAKIQNGGIVKPDTVLPIFELGLTEKEMNAFETIKSTVIEYERLYRNESFNIKNKGLGENEVKAEFEKLIQKHETSLNSLLDGDVTTDVVAYACYYAANFRKNSKNKNEKIDGSRSYPWVCYYQQILSLLYRNNNGMSLISLPDREMDNIEVINGELFIDGKFIQGVDYPDGSYSLKLIDNKPFIVVPKQLPVITEEEKRQAEIAYANKQFMFECSKFTNSNQKVNSEQFIEIIKANNNCFDILVLENGSVGICMNNLVYAIIRECPRTLYNKKVVLVNHSDLLFIPKAKRSTTLMKDDKNAYSQNLKFTVMIKVDEEVDTNIIIPEPEYTEDEYAYSNSYDDMSTEDLMKLYGMVE